MNDFFTVHNRLHEEIVPQNTENQFFALQFLAQNRKRRRVLCCWKVKRKKRSATPEYFGVILLFFHLSHNSKDNFSPRFIFTLLKRKKGIFLRFKTLLQFYRGKFHCKSSKSLVFHTNQEKEGFLLICPLSLSLLISPNLSQDSTRP